MRFPPNVNTLYPQTSSSEGAETANPSANVSITLPQTLQDSGKGQRDWRPAPRCSVCPTWFSAEDKLVQSKQLHLPHSRQAIHEGDHQDTLSGKRLGTVLVTSQFGVSYQLVSKCEQNRKRAAETELLGTVPHQGSGCLRRPTAGLHPPRKAG